MNTEQIMKLVENYASDSSDILAEYDALHTAIEALVRERDAAMAKASSTAFSYSAALLRESDVIEQRDKLAAENKTLRDALEDVHNWSPDGSNAKNLAREALQGEVK